MSSINKVTLIGNLGRNPELRMTAAGNPVTSVSLATNERWRQADGDTTERTEWHRVVLWGRLAEIAAQHLTKGRRVYVEGRLQTRSWEDPTGAKRFATEVVASSLRFLDGPQSENGRPAGEDGAPF